MRKLSQSATITLLLSPAGLLIIVSARLLIVSDYSSATALAILSSNGYVNTLLGAVIPMAPIFMPYVALVLLLFNRLLLSLLTCLLALLISPTAISVSRALALIAREWRLIMHTGVIWLLVMIVLGVLFTAFLLLSIAAVKLRLIARSIAIALCMILGPVISKLYPLPINNSFYADLVRQPWLPADSLTMKSGGNVTGYTLATNGGWFEVLLFGDRAIKFYPESDIVGQHICVVDEPAGTRPLVALVNQPQKELPLCSPVRSVPIGSSVPIFSDARPLTAQGKHSLPVDDIFPHPYRVPRVGRT